MAPESSTRRRARPRAGTRSPPPGTPRSSSSSCLLEGLIDPEITDLHAKWIGANERIRHTVSQREVDLRDIRLAAPFGADPRRVEHLLEGDRRLERRRRELAQTDVLHDDVTLVFGR